MSDLPEPLEPDIAVQDAVHGRIWLTELERSVVSVPAFQRLRHLRQLGLADFVFPTATHSRLAHALGATHVMGWMLRQRPLEQYFKDRQELVILLRLAALLHDVGHYPFSHLGEKVYGSVARGALEAQDAEPAVSLFDIAAQITSHSAASHEAMTAHIIRDTQIGSLIDSAVPQLNGVNASEVLIQIIDGSYFDSVCHSLISSDLDCDRLDYLVRDSASAGMTYGDVDLAYLVENLVIADHDRYGPILAIDLDHGFGAVEHYLHARYFHYARFITHKTIESAELLLAAAMLELIRLERLPSNVEEVRQSVGTEGFLAFTDAKVWSLLSAATSETWASEDLKEAASCLINRTLLKCAWSIDALVEENDATFEHVTLDKLMRMPEGKEKVARGAGLALDRFCYKKNTISLTGIPARTEPKPGGVEYKWVETVNVARENEQPKPIVLCGGLLEHLSTRKWVTRRVYVREPSLRAHDKNAHESRGDTRAVRAYLEGELAR